MFEEWKIRMTLKKLSKQRVALVLNPGNVWVIERKLIPNEDQTSHLHTCQMRGWIEILHDHVPSGRIPQEIEKWNPHFDTVEPIYRITDSGWGIINKNQMISVISLAATILSLITLFK